MEAVIRDHARRLALGFGALILVAAAAPDAKAFGHGGGFRGGFFHGGVGFGVGFGLPGCCFFGGPYGYYPPYYPAYPTYAAYPPYPPPYVAPPAAYAAPAATYSPAAATYGTPAAPAGGGDCREYQSTVTIDGRAQRAFGTVCRQPDGSWRIGAR